MRALLTSVALLTLSVPAMAQERGSFTLDAMTTPGRHFGFGYYITDGLSVRPSLGAEYSGDYGMTFNLGGDLRWEFLTNSRFSPYLAASFNYLRSPYLVAYDPGGSSFQAGDSNVTRYGAGAGIRARLKYRLSLYGEGRVMNSAFQDVPGHALSSQQYVKDGAHFEAALGLSYAFN